MCIHTLSENQIVQLLQDVSFLERALLAATNPDVASDSDALDFTPEQYRDYAKEYFDERLNYSKEFINKVFAK